MSAIMRTALVTVGACLAALALGTALTMAGAHGAAHRAAASPSPVAVAAPDAPCTEDDVCWDCLTMGNQECGPRLELDVPIARALGGICNVEECWVPGEHAVPDSYPCEIGSIDYARRTGDTCWIRSGQES